MIPQRLGNHAPVWRAEHQLPTPFLRRQEILHELLVRTLWIELSVDLVWLGHQADLIEHPVHRPGGPLLQRLTVDAPVSTRERLKNTDHAIRPQESLGAHGPGEWIFPVLVRCTPRPRLNVIGRSQPTSKDGGAIGHPEVKRLGQSFLSVHH